MHAGRPLNLYRANRKWNFHKTSRVRFEMLYSSSGQSKPWSTESLTINFFMPAAITRAHSIFFDSVRQYRGYYSRKHCVTVSRAGFSGRSRVDCADLSSSRLTTTCDVLLCAVLHESLRRVYTTTRCFAHFYGRSPLQQLPDECAGILRAHQRLTDQDCIYTLLLVHPDILGARDTAERA